MNGTHLLIGGVLNGVYNCLGVDAKYRVPLFGEAERELFLEIIEGLSPIREEDKIKIDPTIDFDSDPSGDTSYADWTTVTEKPDGDGQALLLDSSSGSGANLYFAISAIDPGGNCLVYKSDFYIPSEGVDNKYFLQIIIGKAAMLYLHKTDDTVKVYESTKRSGNDNLTRLLATVECDEWFSLELKYYVGDRDNVRLKWYVDGELVAVTDNYYVNEGVSREDADPAAISSGARLHLYAMKTPAVCIYVDNVNGYIVNDEYVTESGDLVYNVDENE